MDLSVRSMAPEEMDAPSTSAEEYAICLRDLAAVNRVTFTHRPTLNWLARVTRDLPREKPITILDIACGHGDLLRAIHRWAAKRNLPVHLSGLDLNPRSADVAAAATPPDMPIVWLTGDVFTYNPEPSPDFIVTSQFAHHLTDAELVTFIAWLNRHAARGWFIADLHRHALAYYGFPILARLAGWHRIVREDGQISIARSFRRPEWINLLAAAGISAEIKWRLPFRYCVGALK
jgi:SAM-dependent methyltransferase